MAIMHWLKSQLIMMGVLSFHWEEETLKVIACDAANKQIVLEQN